MMQLLNVERLFDGESWHQHIEVQIEEGVIRSLKPTDPDFCDGILVPGFIDLQVNGGGGVLFNASPTLDTLRRMVRAHARYGTVALLPTLITDDLRVMERAADTLSEAIASAEPGVLGLHFEGPHLSAPKKGVHPQQHIRPLSERELAIYARQDIGIKLVTVAPECVPPEQIRQLIEQQVTVFLGHSNADAETVLAAIDAGARGFTHLYNAMSPLTSREPGMVGVALVDQSTWCGIILDGHHMHPLAARLALQSKPQGKLLLVTDAMSPVGTDDQHFDLFGEQVTRQNLQLTNSRGQLAGSALDMASAVRYAINQLDVSEDEALRMASRYPAQCLGLSAGFLRKSDAASMVLLDQNWQVQQCWINGMCLPAVDKELLIC